jgi:hypothetical protein
LIDAATLLGDEETLGRVGILAARGLTLRGSTNWKFVATAYHGPRFSG